MLAGATACSNEQENVPEEADYRTILVYMAAQNGLDWAAEDDLAEMREGMKQVAAGNHLVVYYDSNDGLPSLFHLYKDRAGNVREEVLYEYPEQDAASVTVERMSDVFTRAYGAFPAESYGLVFWSHGDGWLPATSTRSFGLDGGEVMDIPELEEAVQSAMTVTSSRLDFIYFDACFMQSVEVAYQLRDYADYIIGCPLETPSPGSPYDVVLAPLFAEGEADVVGMARTYFETYDALYNGGIGGSNTHWTSGVAISVVQTDALEPLATETRTLYARYADSLEELVPDDLWQVQRFDYNRRYNGSYLHAYYDFGDFVIMSVYDMSPNGRYVTGYGMRGMDVLGYMIDLEGGTTSIESKVADQTKASVYPNPVADELHIDMPFGSDEVATTLTLVDMQGRVVRRIDTARQSNTMDVSNLTEGIYVLDVNARGTHKAFKIMVRH